MYVATLPAGCDRRVHALIARNFNPNELRVPGGEHGGEWSRGGGAVKKALKALIGQDALDAVPTEYRSGPRAHYGDYAGASFTGLSGHGSEHALAEYEGVEYEVTNSYLRRRGPRDYAELSDQEVYPGAGYSDQSLMREHDAETAARIAEIDKTMAVSRTTAPVEVDRVIKDGKSAFGQAWHEGVMNAATKDFGEQDREYERWIAGDRPDLTGLSWKEKAYVSTSADTEHSPLFGERWARMAKENPDSQGEPVIMTIRVPQGTGAVQLGQMGWSTGPGGKKIKNSAEILLEHGLTMTVTADHGIDGQGFRRLDVVASRGD